MRSAFIAGAVLLALVMAAPFLVPLSGFIPEVTRVASQKLGQPVEINELKLRLIPTPRLVALGIRVGKKHEATIGQMEIVPDLLSLISGPRSIRLIRAEAVELKEGAFAIPGSMPKNQGGAPLEIRNVMLNGVKVHHSAIRLPEFDIEASLGERLAILAAHFTTRDGAVRIDLKPEGPGAAKVSLHAHKWIVPAGPALFFENLDAEGRLRGQQLDMPAIAGKIHGGSLSGSVRIDWAKQWQLSGKVQLVGVDLVPVQRALGKKPQLSGRLTGETSFSASAKQLDQLGNAMVLDGPFEVLGGAYHGMDLSQVTDLTTGRLASGGATRFDELSGKLQVRGKRSRVNDLCVRSKSLVAGGYVEVAPDQTLSGKLDVSVAKTKGFVGVPIALAGTTAEPSASLTKGAMIGAVIGTVLLPGLGTSLGASAGNAIEGRSGCN